MEEPGETYDPTVTVPVQIFRRPVKSSPVQTSAAATAAVASLVSDSSLPALSVKLTRTLSALPSSSSPGT